MRFEIKKGPKGGKKKKNMFCKLEKKKFLLFFH